MAFISRNHNGVVYHASTLLEGVAHGFSTRLGGVSRGAFASLNFRASGPPGPCPASRRGLRRWMR